MGARGDGPPRRGVVPVGAALERKAAGWRCGPGASADRVAGSDTASLVTTTVLVSRIKTGHTSASRSPRSFHLYPSTRYLYLVGLSTGGPLPLSLGTAKDNCSTSIRGDPLSALPRRARVPCSSACGTSALSHPGLGARRVLRHSTCSLRGHIAARPHDAYGS